MAYFSTRKIFLTPSFDLSEEEEQIFSKYYAFLEESSVGRIIERYVKNQTSKGGRPNVNYYNLFAAILYGFSVGQDSLRDLEDACGHDIRYISIMEQTRPSYSTIANFINQVIVPNELEIFKSINTQIIKTLKINTDDAFLDGSKFEANCNKYKFVWKPLTFHKRLSTTFFQLLHQNSLCEDFHNEDLVKSKTVALAINALENKKSELSDEKYKALSKSLTEILCKVVDYEEKEEICGPSRKSYYKTDRDATAMCLKSDYYSGLGSNMHAAYNTQIIVSRGYILTYFVSQSRSDMQDFIPTLEKYKQLYGQYPKNICADAGYGSLENYLFLEEKQIGNYVKSFSWEGTVSGTYPDSYSLNSDLKTIKCLNGFIGHEVTIENRHPKKAGNKFFQINGCKRCSFRDFCMRFQKNYVDNDFKIFEVNLDFLRLRESAQANLLSPKGIEMRVNRSIQVEGAFGNEKQNRGYTRSRRRGILKVSTETMLVVLGMNVKKLFNFYKTQKQPSFWIAPNNLGTQSIKKPSAKRLSKKGLKINAKTYNNIY